MTHLLLSWLLLSNTAAHSATADASCSPLGQPSHLTPTLTLAKSLGFDVDVDSVAKISASIEAFLQGLPPEQVEKHRQGIRAGSTEILQLIRHLNDLENEVGGWSKLWTGYHQYILSVLGSVGSLSKVVGSFDGLVFFPGPTDDSIIVFGSTFESEDPRALIAMALEMTIEPRTFSIVHLNLLRPLRSGQSRTGQAMQFSAIVRASNDSAVTAGRSHDIVTSRPLRLNSTDNMLVWPTSVDLDKVGLTRQIDGSYSVRLITGYRYNQRVGSGEIITHRDLQGAIRTAVRESAIDPSIVKIIFNADRTEATLQFSQTLTTVTTRDLESQLIRRVQELFNPKQSRLSRTNPIKDGVDLNAARLSRQSGFITKNQVIGYLKIRHLNEGSTLPFNSPGHAIYPELTTPVPGEWILKVDDQLFLPKQTKPVRTSSIADDISPVLGIAHNSPMQPTQTRNDAFIVYFKATPNSSVYGAFVGHYAVFATLERAQAFIANHRFVVAE